MLRTDCSLFYTWRYRVSFRRYSRSSCEVSRHLSQISINQSNQIYIAPYVASESEARVGGSRRSVHVHCKQCQTVLSLKVAWKYWEVQQIYSCMSVWHKGSVTAFWCFRAAKFLEVFQISDPFVQIRVNIDENMFENLVTIDQATSEIRRWKRERKINESSKTAGA